MKFTEFKEKAVKAWKEVDKKEVAVETAKVVGKVGVAYLATVGALMVTVAIAGTIKQKIDPIGFRKEWIEGLIEMTKNDSVQIVDLLAETQV